MQTPSIQVTVEKLMRKMEGNHYSKGVLHDVRFASAQIVRLHEANGYKTLNLKILEDFKNEKRARFESGEFGRSMLNIYCSVANRLESFGTTGSIIAMRPLSGHELPEYYKSILAEVRSTRFGVESVQPQVVSCAYQYFKWLSGNGYQDLRTVTHETVRRYMLSLAERLNGNSLRRVQRNLRALGRHFVTKGYTVKTSETILSMPIAVEKKVLPAMGVGELSQILDYIDRESAMGKRRYAILLLGAVTGLRAGDIAALKFSEIDWRTGSIRLVQSKTKKPLLLPLTFDVGNALQDYILNARPMVASERVFLNTKAPHATVSSGTVITTLADCKRNAGLSPYGGFHSLRRMVGRNMSVAGIPVTTIAQVLGHTELNSTKQYISLDSHHLKTCALGFAGIEPKKSCLCRAQLKNCVIDFTGIHPVKEVCLQ